jgi:hypothetical protein
MFDRYSYVRNNPLKYVDPSGLSLADLQYLFNIYRYQLGVPDELVPLNIVNYFLLNWGFIPATSPTRYISGEYRDGVMIYQYGQASGPGPGAIGQVGPHKEAQYSVNVVVEVTEVNEGTVSGTLVVVTRANETGWWWGSPNVRFNDNSLTTAQMTSDTQWQDTPRGDFKYGRVQTYTWSSDSGRIPTSVELQPWYDDSKSYIGPILRHYLQLGEIDLPVYPIWVPKCDCPPGVSCFCPA